ncbi:Ubiquitin-like protein [Caenorhabditis elegans]|uniref:Ubiquitin-like protein n=2 Tax=Caenorhabditis TaxID=6237 RepID=Q7YX48_CAEEL|nr:Ubiquitin-like protein [Caenorhabditis elegans]CAE17762.1 Ubiquitin-like protein [Caenorhabditis elegans]|eukprot:NP_001021222.1 Ubiquitin-like protein [Caenorhabditis elegans]
MSAKQSIDSQAERVVLRLILVSGKTHEFEFHPLTSAHDVTQMVFDQWPDEWYEDKVQSAQMLKLIYHGRFLHGSVTLHALQLMPGKTTVMHLVTRENLPEPNSSETLTKRKSAGCCRCVLS